MKKLICLLCTLLALLALAAPGNAQDYYKQGGDSDSIPEEVLALLPLQEGDRVIRIYWDDLTKSFFLYSNIEQVLYSENFVEILYAVLSQDGRHNVYKIKNGECEPLQMCYPQEVLDTYLQSDVIRRVDPDIVVEAQYFLYGSYGNVAIYYETDLGDYVYWCYPGRSYPYAPPAGEYLMSVQVFCQLQQSCVNGERKFLRVYDWDSKDFGNFKASWDLSDYDLQSQQCDPDAKFKKPTILRGDEIWLAAFALCACLVIAGTVFAVLWLRKNWFSPACYSGENEDKEGTEVQEA